MHWENIREHYPNQWVLVEATKAHSVPGKRILEELTLLETFDDSMKALRKYAELHRQAPQRELYYLHTSRETLDIEERFWLGIRGLPADTAAETGQGEFAVCKRSLSLPLDGQIACQEVAAAYQQMAADEARERDALEWAEMTLEDVAEEPRREARGDRLRRRSRAWHLYP